MHAITVVDLDDPQPAHKVERVRGGITGTFQMKNLPRRDSVDITNGAEGVHQAITDVTAITAVA
jgi:hypothetical protein